jgi:hypothetical protein
MLLLSGPKPMSMKLQNARPLAAHDLDLQVLLSLDR